MAEDDYKSAQPIGDYYEKANRFLQKYLGDPDKPAFSKPQTINWKPEPNEEQKRQIEKEQGTKTLAQRKPLGSGKATQKKSSRKQTARKR